MAPIATADFVGLDVTAAIAENVVSNTDDWATDSFKLPRYCDNLINSILLGRKVGRGAYATEMTAGGSRKRLCYDVATGHYADFKKVDLQFRDRMVASLRVGDYPDAARALVEDAPEDAKICLAMLVDYVLYSAIMALAIGRSVHDADIAIAEGFNWCPPPVLTDAISLAEDFRRVAHRLAGEGMLLCNNPDGIVGRLEPSYYDYRSFLRAKA